MDPSGGKADIKKIKPVPNYKFVHEPNWKDVYHHPEPFQRKILIKQKVSDYNSKAGKLSL